jgi:RES domain-containing protein
MSRTQNISLYRLCPSKSIKEAFSTGSFSKVGTRFNPPGISVVYASDSVALAKEEIIQYMGMGKRGLKYLTNYNFFIVDVPPECIENFDVTRLPERWNEVPKTQDSVSIGADWYMRGDKPVLRVPSAIDPSKSNYLINPIHPDFSTIVIRGPIRNILEGTRRKKVQKGMIGGGRR